MTYCHSNEAKNLIVLNRLINMDLMLDKYINNCSLTFNYFLFIHTCK